MNTDWPYRVSYSCIFWLDPLPPVYPTQDHNLQAHWSPRDETYRVLGGDPRRSPSDRIYGCQAPIGPSSIRTWCSIAMNYVPISISYYPMELIIHSLSCASGIAYGTWVSSSITVVAHPRTHRLYCRWNYRTLLYYQMMYSTILGPYPRGHLSTSGFIAYRSGILPPLNPIWPSYSLPEPSRSSYYPTESQHWPSRMDRMLQRLCHTWGIVS